MPLYSTPFDGLVIVPTSFESVPTSARLPLLSLLAASRRDRYLNFFAYSKVENWWVLPKRPAAGENLLLPKGGVYIETPLMLA
jgi:hypothetical protein